MKNVFGIVWDKLPDSPVPRNRDVATRLWRVHWDGPQGGGNKPILRETAALASTRRALFSRRHFLPNAVFLFPIVERFALDFVNGRFRDPHAGRLPRHEEINVVNCAVLSFHIDTGEIFPGAETGKPIVMDPDQIKREIFASIVDVKFFVGRFFAFTRDVSFDPGRNIGVADLPRWRALGPLRDRCCYLW
ncbi:MAG: hypothetical protein DME76_18835 [Verrucomicrobia bacterium]|nr:MAG: hypothetical protein DME76_18835 [Verrucomicrobiota bacterium]